MRVIGRVMFCGKLGYLWKRILETSAARVYNLFTGTLGLVLTSHLLGADGLGIVAATVSWVTLFVALGSLSMNHVVVYKAAQTEGNDWFSKTFGALLVLTLFLAAIELCFFSFLYFLTSGKLFGSISLPILALGFMSLPFLLWETYGGSLLVVSGNLRFYNKRMAIVSTIRLILLYLFLRSMQWGVAGALMANLAGNILMACSGIFIMWRLAEKRIVVDFTEIVSLIRDGLKLHLTSIGAHLQSNSDVVMLNYYATQQEVGWYHLATKLTSVVLMFPGAAITVLQSRLQDSNPDKIWPEHKRAALQILALLAFLCAIAYFIVPSIIPVIAGKDFAGSIPVFLWLLPVVLGQTFSIMMSLQWIGRGFFWRTSLITLAVALINVFLNYRLIPVYGVMGAVYATVISFTVFNVTGNFIMAIYCNKKSRECFEAVAHEA